MLWTVVNQKPPCSISKTVFNFLALHTVNLVNFVKNIWRYFQIFQRVSPESEDAILPHVYIREAPEASTSCALCGLFHTTPLTLTLCIFANPIGCAYALSSHCRCIPAQRESLKKWPPSAKRLRVQLSSHRSRRLKVMWWRKRWSADDSSRLQSFIRRVDFELYQSLLSI